MRVVVVGSGSVGRRRASLVAGGPNATLVAVVDVDRGRAEAAAAEHGCLALTSATDAIGRDDVDAVVVSTSNDQHAVVATAALKAGKHVLVEKPLARTPDE